MTKKNLGEVITFRLSEEEFKPFKKILEKRGIKRSRLFREIVTSKASKIVLPKETSADKQQMLFLASKASNNINQVARKLNSAYKGGVVDEELYVQILQHLIYIERAYTSGIKKC